MQLVPVKDIPDQMEDTPTDLMKLFKIFQQMETLSDVESGIGLSAVQVGIPWRAFILKESHPPYSRNAYSYFVDCEYQGKGEKQLSIEGCLSLRDSDGALQHYYVRRYPDIRVTGKKLVDNGKDLVLEDFDVLINLENDGIYTAVFQHEIDHHNGILISDIGTLLQIKPVE